MYILFENFRNIESYIMQRLMVFACKGEWVHCEIVFNEKNNLRASAWDSSGMEFRQWQDIKFERYFELYPLPSEHHNLAYQFCLANQGKKYDRMGVLGMTYKIPFLNSEKIFCSELCHEVTTLYTGLDVPQKQSSLVSPLEMRRMIINQGIEPVPISVLKK